MNNWPSQTIPLALKSHLWSSKSVPAVSKSNKYFPVLLFPLLLKIYSITSLQNEIASARMEARLEEEITKLLKSKEELVKKLSDTEEQGKKDKSLLDQIANLKDQVEDLTDQLSMTKISRDECIFYILVLLSMHSCCISSLTPLRYGASKEGDIRMWKCFAGKKYTGDFTPRIRGTTLLHHGWCRSIYSPN